MSWSLIKQELLGPATGWRWPVYTTLILYILFYVLILLCLGQSFIGAGILIDLGVDLALAFLVFATARRVWPFLLFMLLYFTILYGGSTGLMLMLGRPILPEEVHNLHALIMILGPLGWIGIGLPLVLLAASFVLNIRLNSRHARLAAGAIAVIACAIVFVPMSAVQAVDRIIGNASWSKPQNFYLRGGTVNFLQETMRLMAEDTSPPSEADVAAAMRRIRAAAGEREKVPLGHQRNVHLLLLESFWTPELLKAARFSEPPMDPRFTELWRQTGFTQGLSPAFGGGTANAEFEILCGFPVDQHAANYEYGIKKDVPCLPGFLHDKGYRTVVSHPNESSFWNRAAVYRHIGFETFWSAEFLNYTREELRNYMSDLHLFQQVQDRLKASADGRPVFNFLLTIEGHWDYANTNPGRQSGIVSHSAIGDVGTYANVIHYKSRDFMDIVETLRRDDPDALIVAFGDHLPLLGKGFEGYVESGLLPATYDEFTKENFDFSARTPLIVIDGRNGPLDLGVLPMYQVPHLIARLLGEGGAAMFDLAAAPRATTSRPLPEGHVAYVDGKPAELCRSDPPSALCAAAQDWLRDVKLLDRDVFRGDQHALKLLGLPQPLAQSRQ